MTITEYRWLKHGDPLPDGWRLAEQAITHHHKYGAWIMRIEPP